MTNLTQTSIYSWVFHRYMERIINVSNNLADFFFLISSKLGLSIYPYFSDIDHLNLYFAWEHKASSKSHHRTLFCAKAGNSHLHS